MKRSSVRLSVCPIDRQQQLWPVDLPLSALRAGDIDRQRRAPAPPTRTICVRAQQHCAAARRSAANAGSVALTVEVRG